MLPTREREILRMRFAQDLTQAQIGAAVGVSQMQVSRILRQTLTRLHTHATAGIDAPAQHAASSLPAQAQARRVV